MILVTGATGNLGKTVIDSLLGKVEPTEIAVFARSEDKALDIKKKGIDVRIGNFDDLDSLEKAMDGIDKVLLISSSDHGKLFQQHKNVTDAAKKAGVTHLVYTGFAVKDVGTSPLRLMLEAHFHTEDYIKASGIPFTILRNTVYSDAIPQYIGDEVFENGIYLPVGDGKVPFVLRREMGEAAVNVLLQSGHENKTYVITGSELYSFTDIAQALSELSEKQIIFHNIDARTYEDTLAKAGVPEFGVYVLSAFISDKKDGKYEILSDDMEVLLGRKPLSLKKSLKEIYAL